LNYRSYEAIIYRFRRTRIGKNKLALRLLSSAFGDEGYAALSTIRTGKSDSKLRSGERDIPDEIRCEYSDTDKKKDAEIHEKIKNHFDEKIEPILKKGPYVKELLDMFRELVDGAENISQAKKDDLLELAKPEFLAKFLAETFILAIKQNNSIVADGVSGKAALIQSEDITASEPIPEESLQPAVPPDEPPDPEKEHHDSSDKLLHRLLKFFNPKYSKKGIAILAALFVATAVLVVVFSQEGKHTAQPASGSGTASIEPDFDRHMLLKLEIDLDNAVHQYEMGLNNWRRLDYPRAHRDILAARDEISKHRKQATIEVAKVNNSLGCLYIDMGKYEEAYDYLNSAYETFRRELGPESLEARATKASIAQYDYHTGEFERALQGTQAIIDRSDSENEKAIIASSSHFRALVLDAQGKYDEAIKSYQSVLTLFEEFLEDGELSETLAKYTNDPDVDEQTMSYYTTALKWIILTYNNMGKSYINMGKYEEAESVLCEALSMCLGNDYIGQKNLNTAKVHNNMAIVTMKLNKLGYAVENIEVAIAIQRNLFNFEDVYPGLVESRVVFGDIHLARGDTNKAKEQYEAALSLAETAFGENHPQTAMASNALGEYYVSQSDTAIAISFFERAIRIRDSIVGNKHPDTALFYFNLASTYEKQNDLEKAKNSAVQAYKIQDKLGIVDAIAAETSALLHRLYEQVGASEPFEAWLAQEAVR